MAYLNGRNVGLDGVLAQQANYRKSGFTLAYRNIRCQGKGGGSAPDGLIDLSSVPFEEIGRYDAMLFPAPRPNFLRRWIEQPGGAALGVLNNQRLIGYGVIRPCRQGFKIGPLFADDPKTADKLFRGLSSAPRTSPSSSTRPKSIPTPLHSRSVMTCSRCSRPLACTQRGCPPLAQISVSA